ncbi:MAG: hydrolase, partial [Intestinibacter sp.]
MKFVTYILNDVEVLGIVNSNMTGVYNFKSLGLEKNYVDMNDFISNATEKDLAALKSRDYEKDANIKVDLLENIELCAPIVNPVKD